MENRCLFAQAQYNKNEADLKNNIYFCRCHSVLQVL